jgi:hypothetical protein
MGSSRLILPDPAQNPESKQIQSTVMLERLSVGPALSRLLNPNLPTH